MAKLAALAVSLLVLAHAAAAEAGPTARFGLTGALADQSAPGSYQLGPLIAGGARLGPFVGEVEYAYLSFFETGVSPGGVHRLGVTLRADLVRSFSRCQHYACTRATSFYGELGGGERFGHWMTDANTITPTTSPLPEAHIGLGYEMDNQVWPHRNGWQLGLRFAFSRPDAVTGQACRGTGSCMPITVQPGGLDKAVYLEWMFLIGE